MKQTKATLKTYFETGDRPTSPQFGDLIDSLWADEDFVHAAQQKYSFESLTSLVQQEKLVLGQKYTLSGYKTQYYVEGTNTTNKVKEITNTATVNGYGFYDPGLTDLEVGTSVEVVKLPAGYSGAIKTGDLTNVTISVFGFYIKFANGLHAVNGARFKYSLQRYSNITPDDKVLDANLKIMMQPNGVINTEVHDGTPYMQMTATENRVVPEEEIVLTAISKNQFSTQAESLTFSGELLEYDFTDTEIKNEDDIVIGTRKGLITRRISADKKIDINKDWRVQRYRRYKLEAEHWDNFVLNNAVDHSVYNLGTSNAVTAANVGLTDEHKYVLPFVEVKQFYQDFSNIGKIENVFLDGVDNAPGIAYGYRMETQEDDIYKIDAVAITANNGKDFFILPLDELSNPTDKVQAVIVKNLENTLFLNNSSQFAKENVIEVKITDGIADSTFIAGGKILSASENRVDGLSRITAVDNIKLTNKGKIANLLITATGVINNNGELNYLTFGGMPSNLGGVGVTYINVSFDDLCRIRNTMIGGKRVDSLFFNNVQTNKCLLAFNIGQYLKFSDSILFLTAIKHPGNFYTNNLSIDTIDKNIKKNKYGFYYDEISNAVGKNIFTNSLGDLLYQTIDAANNNTTALITVAKSK